jgi:hypothetical protein
MSIYQDHLDKYNSECDIAKEENETILKWFKIDMEFKRIELDIIK